MPKTNTKLFRKEALDKLSSPEQLDQLIEVVSPKAWLPLCALSGLVLTATLWGIFGRLPLTVQGQGVLVRPRRVIQFQSPSAGHVVNWKMQPGDLIQKGAVIGTIDQASIKQELQQEKNKFRDLLAQTGESAEVKRLQIQLKRDIIEQKRQVLESSLSDAQALSPVLRDKGILAIQENRAALNLRLEKIRALLPELEQQLAGRQRLLDAGAISKDNLLDIKQQYFNSLGQVADLESQLQQLDSKEVETQLQFSQNESKIKETQTQLQDLATEEAQLKQEELDLAFDRTNKLDEIRRRIAQLELQLSNQSQIISPYTGRLLEIAISPGQVVNQGTMLGTLQAEDPAEALVSLAFFADKDGKQIKAGMSAQVTPSTVKRERFGGIEGRVTEVSPFPVTSQNVAAMIGNPDLAEQLVKKSAPVQILIDMEKNADTSSGYRWTSSSGPNTEISSGTSALIQVKIGEIAPVSYIIPIFREWTGIY